MQNSIRVSEIGRGQRNRPLRMEPAPAVATRARSGAGARTHGPRPRARSHRTGRPGARALILGLAIVCAGAAACEESARSSGSVGAARVSAEPPAIDASALAFATYLGGDNARRGHPRPGEDTVRDVTIDAAGNVYVTGGTANPAFPVRNAHQRAFGGGDHDVFVAKLSPAGVLLWSTFLGGPNYDRAYAIELDAAGNVYVGGRAGDGFPTTRGVLQPRFAGDDEPNRLYREQDGFVAKLDNDGRRIWSTYLGGPGSGFLRDIDVDVAGNVYVSVSEDADSPWVTPGAFQTTRHGDYDAIVGKLLPDASGLEWCSYLSGSGRELGTPSIRVDAAGYVYVLGGTSSTDLPTNAASFRPAHAGGNVWDMALFKFLPDGSDIVYGAYVGGTGNEFSETHGLVVDVEGRAIVGVSTTSADFPTTAGASQRDYAGGGRDRGNYPGDGLVAIVSADGARLVAATYFGGSEGEGIEGIGLGPNREILIAGATYSSDMPIQRASGVYQASNAGGADQFLAVLRADLGALEYSTYIGGSGTDFARSLVTDEAGRVVVGGQTNSTDFPVSNAHQDANAGGVYDGAVTVFSFGERAP